MPPEQSVTLRDIYEARRTIAPWVRRTPLVLSSALSQRTGASVYLKLETAHDTGAFKIRGATNCIQHLSAEERRRGVVAVSTGNHGRAVAYAARRAGVRAVVCVSSLVPEGKVAAIRDLGAEVHVVGRSQDEADVEAARLIEEEELVPVPPFDHPYVIAGQGTIGVELLEDLAAVDCVLVGLSGGGLISGIAVALKAAWPRTRVVGITMERGAAMYASIQAGRPVQVEEEPSLADSLGGGIGLENRCTFDLVRDLVDEYVLLPEAEIAEGMRHLYRTERVISEGAGAVGVAALLAERISGLWGNVVCVISGGNVDMDAFARVMAGASA